MKHTKLFSLVCYFLIPCSTIRAVTINGRDINEYCQYGQTAQFCIDATSSVLISMTNNDVIITSVPIDDSLHTVLTQSYTTLKSHKTSAAQQSLQTLVSHTKNILYGRRAHATDNDHIILQNDTIIDIADNIMDAPIIACVGNLISLRDCYMHTRQLHLQSSHPDSLLESIIFIFDEDLAVPPLVQGYIDFSTGTTMSDIIVCGARQVHLFFKPEAFRSPNERELPSNYGTHMTCLLTAAINTSGPILEMGAGDYSTPLLHAVCAKDKRYLLSTDTDKAWLSHFIDLETDWHQFSYVNVYEDDWEVNPKPELWNAIGGDRHWSVVFVDHRPGERRAVDIARLRLNTDIFVVHDTEPSEYTDYGYEPLLSTFKYRYVHKRYTTYTTVVSDTIDVREFF